mgnify:CR=1 FL=1
MLHLFLNVKFIPTLLLLLSIGVTSGRVFCGTTGGNVRCEYTLHGTVVNLSARLMGASRNRVLVDLSTWNATKSLVIYEPQHMIEVKGRDGKFPVFVPLSDECQPGNSERIEFPSINDNPYSDPLIGRDQELKAINQGFKDLTSSRSKSNIHVFRGTPGCGQSHIFSWSSDKAPLHGVKLVTGVGLDTEANVDYFAWRSVLVQLFNIKDDKRVCS